jgi:hypothetical protein
MRLNRQGNIRAGDDSSAAAAAASNSVSVYVVRTAAAAAAAAHYKVVEWLFCCGNRECSITCEGMNLPCLTRAIVVCDSCFCATRSRIES